MQAGEKKEVLVQASLKCSLTGGLRGPEQEARSDRPVNSVAGAQP